MSRKRKSFVAAYPPEWYRQQSSQYAQRVPEPVVKVQEVETDKYAAYLQSEHWLTFRLNILAKRGALCERCGTHRAVQVHHLTYARVGRELPSDVQVLCRLCHQRVHFILPMLADLPRKRRNKMARKFKVTQAFPSKQRICGPHDEDPPWSPGNRYSGVEGGIQGKRPSTEHTVSEADPRTGMTLRAGEARPKE